MTYRMFHVKLLITLLIPCFYSQAQTKTSTVWLEVKTVPEPLKKDTAVQRFNASQLGYENLNANEKEWLYWINEFRSNPRLFWDSAVAPILKTYPSLNGNYANSLKRELYQSNRLLLFTLNKTLLETSKNHALDISKHQLTPSHNSSNGDSFSLRITKAGIKYCAGENISIGNQSVLLSLILLLLDINLPELGHRKNLLSTSFTELGIGTALLKDGSLFTVQDYACTQNK